MSYDSKALAEQIQEKLPEPLPGTADASAT